MSGTIDVVKMITDRMAWLSDRQRILAQNVANVDTPDYQARDIAPMDFSNTLQQAMLRPTATNPMHIGSAAGGVSGAPVVKVKGNATSLNGNAVDLESEMMKVSQTGMDYQTMTALYKKWQGLIRTALGRM